MEKKNKNNDDKVRDPGDDTLDRTDAALDRGAETINEAAQGMTNHPAGEEVKEQSELPPRGHRKDDPTGEKHQSDKV